MTRSWAWVLLLLAGLLPVHALADEILESCPVAHAQSHDHHHEDDRDPHGVHQDASPASCHQHCSLAPPVSQGRALIDRHAFPIPLVPAPLELGVPERDATPTAARYLGIPAIACSSAFHMGVGLRLYA